MGQHHAGEARRDARPDREVRAIPIVEPAATHAVGLVVPDREPMTPLITALVAEARQLAKLLEQPSSPLGEVA